MTIKIIIRITTMFMMILRTLIMLKIMYKTTTITIIKAMIINMERMMTSIRTMTKKIMKKTLREMRNKKLVIG